MAGGCSQGTSIVSDGVSIVRGARSRAAGAAEARASRSAVSSGPGRHDFGVLKADSLRLEVFFSFPDAEAVWRTAEDRCFCHVFQTFDWLAAWYETIGLAEHVRPCIVHVVDRHGETAMLWPIGIRRQNGLSFLTFLGGIVSDYHAPLVAMDFARSINSAFVNAFLRRLLIAIPRVDVIAFERMPGMLGAISNPLVGLPGTRHVWSAHLAHLPPSFEQFKRARSNKLFSDAARRWRRLLPLGEPRFELSPGPEATVAIFEALARQKRRRWRESGARDLFALPGHLAFYRRLVDRLVSGGLVHLSAFSVGETIVATHLGAVFRGRFYYLMPGYEAGDWNRFSVGRQLLQRLVEWSIEAGLQEFDLTVGDEAFKAEWADLSLPLYDYRQPVTIAGRLYGFAIEARERIRARAKRIEPLRRIVRRLRRRR